MAANDTAGTLLTFRGWALHDRTTLAFNRQPLPPLGELDRRSRRLSPTRCSTSHSGFAHRPGYYAKLAWQPPVPVRVELFHYDNRANPQDVNSAPSGAGTPVSIMSALSPTSAAGAELKGQALQGRTHMGYPMHGRRWVDERFRSALRAGQPAVRESRSRRPRRDAFDTRNRGSLVGRRI